MHSQNTRRHALLSLDKRTRSPRYIFRVHHSAASTGLTTITYRLVAVWCARARARSLKVKVLLTCAMRTAAGRVEAANTATAALGTRRFADDAE